jgi:hypothetical protein
VMLRAAHQTTISHSDREQTAQRLNPVTHLYRS